MKLNRDIRHVLTGTFADKLRTLLITLLLPWLLLGACTGSSDADANGEDTSANHANGASEATGNEGDGSNETDVYPASAISHSRGRRLVSEGYARLELVSFYAAGPDQEPATLVAYQRPAGTPEASDRIHHFYVELGNGRVASVDHFALRESELDDFFAGIIDENRQYLGEWHTYFFISDLNGNGREELVGWRELRGMFFPEVFEYHRGDFINTFAYSLAHFGEGVHLYVELLIPQPDARGFSAYVPRMSGGYNRDMWEWNEESTTFDLVSRETVASKPMK